MRVFISWSGERSKAIATALHNWLPKVIQTLEPWISAHDIEKGTRWAQELATQLQDTRLGIICLVPENQDSSWIHFEAGALSKVVANSYVCPVLFELGPAQVTGALSQFQMTRLERDEMRALVLTIHNATGSTLRREIVEESFETWWSKLEEKLKCMPATAEPVARPRKTEELLEEMLQLVRGIDRDFRRPAEPPPATPPSGKKLTNPLTSDLVPPDQSVNVDFISPPPKTVLPK